MKNFTNYLTLVLVILLICLSCQREITLQVPGPNIPDGGKISGNIILPSNFKVDTTGLRVLSLTAEAFPYKNSFVIDTTGQTSTILLNNKNGDVLLMGYNYPGQTDHNLTVESTTLALVMNTPAIQSLTTGAQVKLIRDMNSDPKFKAVSEEISRLLESGKSISDTSNIKLIKGVSELFNDMSNLRTSGLPYHDDPVKVDRANTTLLLQNNGVSHSYVAGVYKDGKLQKSYTLAGQTKFAGSLLDLYNSFIGVGYGMPGEVYHLMGGDGEYQIKIRSGHPLHPDDSNEHGLAIRENVLYYFFAVFLQKMPIKDKCAAEIRSKFAAIAGDIITANEVQLKKTQSQGEYAALLFQMTATLYRSAEQILSKCAGTEPTGRFFTGLGKILGVINRVGDIATAGNITFHTIDLFLSKPAIDACFIVKNKKASICQEDLIYKISIVDGNNQEGIANQKLPKPLIIKVTDSAGKPVKKMNVNWVLKYGGGKLSELVSSTDEQGLTSVEWTLGSSNDVQVVETYVNKVTGSTTASFSAMILLNRPNKIEMVSGNNQQAEIWKPAKESLKVRVTNAKGSNLAGVKVYWKGIPHNDYNSFTIFSYTDQSGIAELVWTLQGWKPATLSLHAYVLDENDVPISGSPVVFTAQSKTECELGITSAPVISAIDMGECNTRGQVTARISFTADGSGLFRAGTELGQCNVEETCYPIRVLYKTSKMANFELLTNGYAPTPGYLQGNKNKGVIEIYFFTGCRDGKSPRQTLSEVWDGAEMRVQLMNACNQRSEFFDF